MKKNLWMLGMAVMAMTSCTQNEVLDVPESRVIGFEPFVNKSTRAAIQIQQNQTSDYTGTPPSDNLYQFWVLAKLDGDALFDGTEKSARVYYKNSPTSGFTYDNHKAWQNGTYSFAAYSNGNHPLTTETMTDGKVTDANELKVKYEEIGTTDVVTGSKLTFENYKVGDYDLLAAIAKTETLENPSTATNVPFTFKHMLSCIHITLENASTNLYLQISDIEFSGVKEAKGEFTYSKGDDENWNYDIKWTSYSSTDGENTNSVKVEKYIFEGTDINAENVSNDEVNNAAYIGPNGGTLNMRYFVIPQSNQTFNNIELKVKSYTYDESATPKYTAAKTGEDAVEEKTISLAITGDHSSWKPGYQYNYRGSLTGDAHWIHFTVQPTENWKSTDVSGSVITK